MGMADQPPFASANLDRLLPPMRNIPDPSPWIRPHISDLHPYIPGEQPAGKALLKLNTNENPYGPSPHVLEAMKGAIGDGLRLYPNPTADPLREQLAKLHGCSPEQIIVGNGSDELLALATRAFVSPSPLPLGTSHKNQRDVIQYFTPSYSLYPVLTAIHGARAQEVPLTRSFGIPSAQRLADAGWLPDAALSFVTTPNAPSGKSYLTSELRRLCDATKGPLILDEAYVDFAPEHALELVQEFNHVMVTRTFSKAYSLCFQRIGYLVGPEPLVTALHKIRDSYNVNGLAQVAATATLEDLGYYRKNFQRVIRERERLSATLQEWSFNVLPSATNFVLIAPPRKTRPASWWYEQLREKNILVRWFSQPPINRYLRISIGTRPQNTRLLRTIQGLLSEQ